MDSDQTAPWSSLIRVHNVCSHDKNVVKTWECIYSRHNKQVTTLAIRCFYLQGEAKHTKAVH